MSLSSIPHTPDHPLQRRPGLIMVSVLLLLASLQGLAMGAMVNGEGAGGAGEDRTPVPSHERIMSAMEVAQEKIPDLRSTLTPPAHAALAQRLLTQATGTKLTSVDRWALLRLAALQAADAGDAELVTRIEGVADKTFLIKDPEREQLSILTQPGSSVPPAVQRRLALALAVLARDAVAHDRYGIAISALSDAVADADRCGDGLLADSLHRRADGVQQLGAHFQAAHERAATDVLGNPADPAAYFILGHFYCIDKHDWTTGLPLLAQGSDARLAALAKAELASPKDAPGQLKIADGWWDYAHDQRDAERPGTLAHAAAWYRQVASRVVATEQKRVAGRIAAVSRFLQEAADAAAPRFLAGAALILTCEPEDVVTRGTETFIRDHSGYGTECPLLGCTLQIGDFGGALSFTTPTSHVLLGNPSELQITGDMTISMWIRPSAFTVRRNLFGKAYGGEMTLDLEIDGQPSFYYGTSGANAAPTTAFTLGTPLPLNTWTQITLVRDLSYNRLIWYRNGRMANQEAAPFPKATASQLPAFVGQGYLNNYAGLMNDIMIWNRALTASQVDALFRATIANRL